MGWLERLGLHRRELRAWAMYDWANSAFATTIMAAVLPIFYADVAAADLEPHLRTARWGYTAGIGLLCVALLGPLLGAMADLMGAKKKFLLVFMSLGVMASALLATVDTGQWLWCSAIFVVGQVGFAGANIFYDSLLPHVARDNEMDRISTAGFAIGYLGGGLLLLVNLAWILQPEFFGFANAGAATKASFISVAFWWAIFSIPLFLGVREPQSENNGNIHWTQGFSQVVGTIRSLPKYRHLLFFLVAYWFYSDGIGTIIKMATIFGKEVGIGQTHLIGALALVQFLGIPCTFAFGAIAGRFSAKAGIFICLCVYTVICILGYYMQANWHFWALAVLVAMVQGGAQGLSRSLFASMIPKSRSSEFFSFISISGKFAGIVGPLVFAFISEHAEDSRNSILFLITFFAIGAFLLTRVDVAKGRQDAIAAEAMP